MSLASQRLRPRHTYYSSLFFCASIFFISCVTAFAQGSVGSTRGLPSAGGGGGNVIQGRVYFPSEPAGGKRIRVRLTSTEMVEQSTTTDEDGAFVFNGLSRGHYTITVDGGKEFDQATENVLIESEDSNAGGRTRNIYINLKPKGTAEALDKIPKEARDFYTKGMEAASKADSKKAAENLSKAVELYPQFPQALSELGVQYLKLGQADKAAESLQAALKLAPQDLPTRLSYGIALMNEKKFTEAELELRLVLTKNSAIPTAHMYLGIVLLSTSRDEKTKQYDMARYTEAQKEFEVAVSTGKDEVAMAHRYLGGIYAGNRDYKRGADELETYLKLAPKASDAERVKAAIKELRSKQ